MSKKKVIVIAVVAVVGITATIGVKSLFGRNSAVNASGMWTDTTFAETETVITRVTGKGEVSLVNTELIYTSIEAEVAEVLVEKNDTVKKGQTLIRYKEKTREDLENAIKEAKLSVESAQISLNTEMIPDDPVPQTTVERAKLDVERSELAAGDARDALKDLEDKISKREDDLIEAKAELDDTKKLLDIGAIPQSDYDAKTKEIKAIEDSVEELKKTIKIKENDMLSAQQELDYKQLSYEETINPKKDSTKQNRIKQQQITLEKSKLNLEKLENELENFAEEILSPIDGTVTEVNVSRGELTSTSKSIMEIADVSDYVVKTDINERNSGRIQIGQDVEIKGAVLGDEIVSGKVSKIGYIAEAKTTSNQTEKVIPVEISVEKSETTSALKPGFSLDVAIITAVYENVVTVPILSTVSESGGNYFVFVVKEDNTLEKRQVELGAYSDMSVEVTGVSEGEKIVSQPSIDMHDGMMISVPAEVGDDL